MLSADEIAKLPSTKIGLRRPIETLRADLKNIARTVKSLKDRTAPVQQITDTEDRAEAIANIQLAYRHLEDARMRLGKVLQASDGDVSVYDK